MKSIISSKSTRLAVGLAAAAAAFGIHASAQSADALLDKLVEKGVLTTDEATELRDQSDKDFTKAYQVKSGMPDWVTTFRIGGDFRSRYEGFWSSNDLFETQNRFRYRARLSFNAIMMDDFEVGVRLGSGDIDNASGISAGVDPISLNQTMRNNASKKGVFIDLAYMKWSPIHTPEWSGAFTVGKMENPFLFSDMVFDNDYTPEGLAQTFSYRLTDQQVVSLTGAQFILDEIGTTSGGLRSEQDPFLLGGQALLTSTWTPGFSTTLGGGYMSILNEESLTSAAVPNINWGNERYTADVAGNTILLAPVSDFNVLVADAAATYTLKEVPLFPGAFPIMVWGEYLYNTGAASDQDTGYTMGVTFGKAGKRGTWELGYRWENLEGDAWWEELTDSDFGGFYANKLPKPAPSQARNLAAGYFSGTNTRGSIIRAAYSPYDYLTLSAKVFFTRLIEPYMPDSDSQMTRFQLDASIKF